jgi:hypothetical protein
MYREYAPIKVIATSWWDFPMRIAWIRGVTPPDGRTRAYGSILHELPGTLNDQRRETNMKSVIPNLHKIVDVLIFDSTQYLPRLDNYSDYPVIDDKCCRIPLDLSRVLWLWRSSPSTGGVEMVSSVRLE